MSEKKNVQALRQAAIDYMREMSQIKWTASEDIDLTVIKNTLFYKKGETYYGVIYNTNEGVDGETFASYIDENGFFRGPVAKKECPGNHCTSTILIALPLIIAFIFLQNKIVQGIERSGIVG